MESRAATANDIGAIAGLHADSWRRNYRGAYLDAYLDGDVVADRMRIWTDRLARPQVDQFTIVAEHDGAFLGFAHTILDADESWGALLENLHVAHNVRRGGIGTRLMAEAARGLIQRRPTSGLYLTVLEQNTSAQAFYAARGGTFAGRKIAGPFPGGGTAAVLRFAWPDPSTLINQS